MKSGTNVVPNDPRGKGIVEGEGCFTHFKEIKEAQYGFCDRFRIFANLHISVSCLSVCFSCFVFRLQIYC